MDHMHWSSFSTLKLTAQGKVEGHHHVTMLTPLLLPISIINRKIHRNSNVSKYPGLVFSVFLNELENIFKPALSRVRLEPGLSKGG